MDYIPTLLQFYETASTGEKPFVITLYDLAKSFNKPPRIIELGTGGGNTLKPLALAAYELGGIVYTIDDGRENASRPLQTIRDLKGFDLDKKVIYTCMDDTSEFAINFFQKIIKKEGLFDLIFIDTSHTYEQTLKELELYSNFLILGGYFALHDSSPIYNGPGTYGVREAIKTFLKQPNFLWIQDRQEAAGLAILKKMG